MSTRENIRLIARTPLRQHILQQLTGNNRESSGLVVEDLT